MVATYTVIRYTYIPLERIVYMHQHGAGREKMDVKTIVNFSHPLSEVAMAQLGDPIVEDVKVQLDISSPLEPQIQRIVNKVDTQLDGTVPGLAIVLPGMSEATAYILAELHGRMGTFPYIIALRRDDGQGIFVVEGVHSLESTRQDARTRRT